MDRDNTTQKSITFLKGYTIVYKSSKTRAITVGPQKLERPFLEMHNMH